VLLAVGFWRVAALWSILRFGTGASQAVAGEIDAMPSQDRAPISNSILAFIMLHFT